MAGEKAGTGGNGDSAGEDEGSAGDGSGTGGSTEDVTVEVELPVTWTEDGKAVAYVAYEFNDSEILAHFPAETWGSGKRMKLKGTMVLELTDGATGDVETVTEEILFVILMPGYTSLTVKGKVCKTKFHHVTAALDNRQ